MAEWEVVLTFRLATKVQGDGYCGAHDAAGELAARIAQDVGDKLHLPMDAHRIDIKRQLGEPWARTHGFFHDREDAPSDVIVVDRAHGQDFTNTDIGILRDRLSAMGFKITGGWNGAGCDTVSFRIGNRKGSTQLTDEQVKALCAPREVVA